MRMIHLFYTLLLLPIIAQGFDGNGNYIYRENDNTFMQLSFKSGGEVDFNIVSLTRNGSASGRFVQQGEILTVTFPDAMKKYPELKSAFPERKSGQLEGRLFIEQDGSLSVEGMWALQFKPVAH
ncbi:hypothetical protein AXE65_10310 [Ventosimonas gracilis]|uniref:Uncharacterized protein n=1 Tax=Ventosimonas gracilis TaxID=1680762 RepID=A0A139SWT6_9GAMM|nr:hypothetical protein [Ventosimonas gracilis]KXU39096.1 hypothetical protein AXE65_10310 [Ventosimonas gracilis]